MTVSFSKKQIIITLFVVGAVILRLLPHPPNVTPITAMALFSGVYFTNKYYAFIIPIVIMFISDLFLGFSAISLFVYSAFILVGYIGVLSKKVSLKTILISSISFFIISNFGVWLLWYPKTIDGLLECYTLAIPFFRNSLLGDFFFAAILYYGFEFVSKKYLSVT